MNKTIMQLTQVETWPSRVEPQERFDQKVQTAMNQMSVMVEELNTDFIPKVNQFNQELEDKAGQQIIMYAEELPDETPENLIENGLMFIGNTVYQKRNGELVEVNISDKQLLTSITASLEEISNTLENLDNNKFDKNGGEIEGEVTITDESPAFTLKYKNNDGTVTPETDQIARVEITDKNNNPMGFIEHIHKSNGESVIRIVSKNYQESEQQESEVNLITSKDRNVLTIPTPLNTASQKEAINAEWALENLVKKSGDTIKGDVTISSATPKLTLSQNDITFGGTQTTLQESKIPFTDKDGEEFASVSAGIDADNTTFISLKVRRNVEDSEDVAEVKLTYPPEGEPITSAPTPDWEDDSTKWATTHYVKDQLRYEIEAMSSGRNTVIRDQWGYPHIMVVIPRFNLEDIDASLGTGTHPAFILNGQVKNEIFIGKYIASQGSDGRAKTLPGKFPWVNIDFDDSLAAARAVGNGFGLMTHAMASARAIWLWKQFGVHEYLGNTNYGRNHTKTWQTGQMNMTNLKPGDTGAWNAGYSNATTTGSGPVQWNDDETAWGISDLVGNVWEWESGFRTNNGEIQVIPENNAMLHTVDMSATSSAWKAVLANGSYVNPGTANTLKFHNSVAGTKTTWTTEGGVVLNTTLQYPNGSGYSAQILKDMTTSVTDLAYAKAMGMAPLSKDGAVQGYWWTCTKGERLPFRGGCWHDGAKCGPFAVYCNVGRSYLTRSIGFRLAFAL